MKLDNDIKVKEVFTDSWVLHEVPVFLAEIVFSEYLMRRIELSCNQGPFL